MIDQPFQRAVLVGHIRQVGSAGRVIIPAHRAADADALAHQVVVFKPGKALDLGDVRQLHLPQVAAVKFTPVEIMVTGNEEAWAGELAEKLQAALKKPQWVAHVASQDEEIGLALADTLRKVEEKGPLGRPVVQVRGDQNTHRMTWNAW